MPGLLSCSHRRGGTQCTQTWQAWLPRARSRSSRAPRGPPPASAPPAAPRLVLGPARQRGGLLVAHDAQVAQAVQLLQTVHQVDVLFRQGRCVRASRLLRAGGYAVGAEVEAVGVRRAELAGRDVGLSRAAAPPPALASLVASKHGSGRTSTTFFRCMSARRPSFSFSSLKCACWRRSCAHMRSRFSAASSSCRRSRARHSRARGAMGRRGDWHAARRGTGGSWQSHHPGKQHPPSQQPCLQPAEQHPPSRQARPPAHLLLAVRAQQAAQRDRGPLLRARAARLQQ